MFSERRGIEDQHAVGFADLLADLPNEFVDHRSVIPWRLSDELLHRLPILIVQVGDGFGVFSFYVGEQTAHVLPNMPLSLAADETVGERRHEGFQTIQHSAGDAFIQNRIVQQFFQPHIKSPFHRLLLSMKYSSRKGLLPKELQSVNRKIQSN